MSRFISRNGWNRLQLLFVVLFIIHFICDDCNSSIVVIVVVFWVFSLSVVFFCYDGWNSRLNCVRVVNVFSIILICDAWNTFLFYLLTVVLFFIFQLWRLKQLLVSRRSCDWMHAPGDVSSSIVKFRVQMQVLWYLKNTILQSRLFVDILVHFWLGSVEPTHILVGMITLIFLTTIYGELVCPSTDLC